MTALKNRPECGWSHTGFMLIDSRGGALGPAGAHSGSKACPATLATLLKGDALVAQSSVVVERRLLSDVDGYDTAFPICGDYELWLRLACRSSAALIPEALVSVRRHKDHYSDDIAACRDFLGALTKTARTGVSKQLNGALGCRRAQAAATLARSCAIRRERSQMFSAVISSAAFGWRHGSWWRGCATAFAYACTSSGTRAAARRLLRSRRTML